MQDTDLDIHRACIVIGATLGIRIYTERSIHDMQCPDPAPRQVTGKLTQKEQPSRNKTPTFWQNKNKNLIKHYQASNLKINIVTALQNSKHCEFQPPVFIQNNSI